jgi:hypothetical protein
MDPNVRTNNYLKRDKGNRGNTDFRWFSLWPTSTRQSLLLAIFFLDIFDCIQDSIYRERIWTLQVSSTSTLTIIYHLVTLVSWVYVTFFSWVLVTLVSIRPHKPNGIMQTLRFNLEFQRARKKMAIMAWIEKSVSMTEAWTSVNLAGIGYYAQNLDIGNFGRKWLLLPELSQLWAWNIFGHICFQQERIGWWYLLVKETMAMRHVILTKRETHMGVGREISRAQD